MFEAPPRGAPPEPPANCPLCPRLVSFREDNRKAYPAYFNGAAPSPLGAATAARSESNSAVKTEEATPQPAGVRGVRSSWFVIDGRRVGTFYIDAGENVLFVDQFAGFPESELGDGVHPNQAGYERMAGKWWEAIESYLP